MHYPQNKWKKTSQANHGSPRHKAWTHPTWVASCSESVESGEHVAFSVAGFHAFSAVCSFTASSSDTVITLRVGVWSARPPLWCRRDITALADTADLVNGGPPTMGGGGTYIGSMFTGKLGRKYWRRRASDGCYSFHQQHHTDKHTDDQRWETELKMWLHWILTTSRTQSQPCLTSKT